MNTIIIEDEKLSAEHLANLLKKIDSNIQILATFDTVKKSVENFRNGMKADLLFVDIHLADGISFEIFSEIVIETPVIFTTAYDEYAIRSFKVNSIDYLLKPIGIDELKRSVEKFQKNIKQSIPVLPGKINDAYSIINRQYKTRFTVKIGDSIIPVKSNDIVHCVAEDGMVFIVTKNGKRYPIDYSLEQLEELLDPDLFFRINRKVIISISSIQKASMYFNSRLKITADLLSDDDLIVSRERVYDFKQWMNK
ncbi:MAG: LytTR family DNA-binding domain-containing protein [Bacteroidota bacterium]